jgi:3-oxosteroid 1-dehydrogenase
MQFDEEFDLVIVGSGGGSICAALAARDAGLSAVILEKQEKVGGSTGFSAGVMWVPNNHLMARAGIPDSYERSRTYFDATVTYEGPGTTPERREAFLKSGPEVVCFLESKGMRFERVEGFSDYYDELPGGEPRGRVLVAELFDINELGPWKSRLSIYPGMSVRFSPTEIADLILFKRTRNGLRTAAKLALRVSCSMLLGRDVRGAGGALQGRMLQIALRERVPIRPKCPVVDFVVESDRVVGVEVAHAGGTRTIGARRGVLINAGGFARNSGMRERFGPKPNSTSWTMANPGDTGEVQQAAIALGAATDCLDEAWWALTSLGPDESFPPQSITADGTPAPIPHHMDVSLPHCILVDQDGRRFVNESTSYMEKGQQLYARQHETGRAVPAWAIIESRHRRRYPWGSALGRTPRNWLKSGYMRKADSLDALARVCGIDPTGLQHTVERFNGFCATGQDDDYGRGARVSDRAFSDPRVGPNPNLGEISRPPFYAVAIYPSDIGTAGGLVTDEHARVLRGDNSVIEGLYATGNSTASVVGRTYPCGGASISASFIFGYRAAQHVAATSIDVQKKTMSDA